MIVLRVPFLRQGLAYGPICRDSLVTKAATREGNKWDWRRYTAATTKRISYYQKLGQTRVLHAPGSSTKTGNTFTPLIGKRIMRP